VSVFGTEDDQRLTMEGLKAAAPYVKGELARRLQMRRTPEVVFLLDRALERGTSVLGLLNQLERKREERGEIPPGSDEGVVAASGPLDERVVGNNPGAPPADGPGMDVAVDPGDAVESGRS
jgi:hypothetical protein